MRISFLIEAAVIVVVGLVSTIEGIRLIGVKKFQYDALGPEYYSIGLGVILIMLGSMYYISQSRRMPERESKVTEKQPSDEERRRYKMMMLSMIAVMVMYIFLIDLIGYLFASAIFFFLLNRVVGFRSWLTNLAATIGMTVSYYVVFVKCMEMIFPRGMLIHF